MLEDVQNLVERCIGGDRKAWERFIKRFSGLLYFSARRRLKRNGIFFGQQDLDDIVQGIFLELWEKRRLEAVRERARIGAWLSIIAQTRALNYMVRKKERLLPEEDLFRLDNLKVEPLVYQGPEEDDRIEELLKDLGPRDNIILKMSIFYDKTHREIARVMRLPLGTVSTIIARKKSQLKEKFLMG